MTGQELAADEKVCPYCAEVIKAAAIKCRYCGSDLGGEPTSAPQGQDTSEPVDTGVEPGDESESDESAVAESPADKVTVAAADAEPAETDAEEGADERAEGSEPAPPTPWYARKEIALVLVLIALGLATFLVGRHKWHADTTPGGQIVSEGARAALLDEASSATETILSYRAKSFAKDSAAAEKLMTASMKADYVKQLSQLRANVTKYGINLTAKVVAIGLISATPQRVKALAFVEQSTTARNSKNTQGQYQRTVITMQHTAGGWRVSDIEPVTAK